MKVLRTRRYRVASAPTLPTLQVDMDGDWHRYTRQLQKGCEVLAFMTSGNDDHGAMVRLATTGDQVKIIGGKTIMLNQIRLRMKLEPLEPQEVSPVLGMNAVG